MARQRKIKLSKYLCFVLRHKPGALGIELDKQAWTDVDLLLKKMNEAGKNISFTLLKENSRSGVWNTKSP